MQTYTFRSSTTAGLVATAAAKTAVDHVIGSFIGDRKGPTLIVIGSLHGNELAGAKALERVAGHLAALEHKLFGRVFLLRGNTRALERGTRYVDADLNRHWTSDHMGKYPTLPGRFVAEDAELRELDDILDHILITAQDEVYVLDLHSTSAEGTPFATVGDTLRNRSFAQKFPVTILLGIEEQLDGTLLEYLNNAGAVTLGFEGGQHEADNTVANHEAMTWLALLNAGLIAGNDVPSLDMHRRVLSKNERAHVFEVRLRHSVTPADKFVMDPGFDNFDPIRKGEALANDRHGRVLAEESGVILMPLYQKLGDDGYFIGRRVAKFWLWLSGVLRRLRAQDLIHLLPGVTRDPAAPERIFVDTHVARFFPLQVFHLLGFRRRRWEADQLVVSRRKHDTVSPFRTKS